MATILLIDDDEDLTHFLGDELRNRGHLVDCLQQPEHGPDLLARGAYEVVLLDNKMPCMSGIDFLGALRQRGIRVPVVLMTGHATTDTAIQAINLGAFDYVVKPDDFAGLLVELEPLIGRAAAIGQAMKEHVRLPGAPVARDARPGSVLLGNSKSMLEVYKLIGRFASSAAAVLIVGATGTGKGMVAKAIHSNSASKSKPFVVLDCNAPNESVLEDELFGHITGAFTGAGKLRKGSFEHANGGTVFLDKIEDLPLSLQGKVLRVLENREVYRQGSAQAVGIEVRVLAATRSDLEVAVREGRFREDLFYRLKEVTIRLPPLRDRGADLQVLVEHFLMLAAEENGRPGLVLEAGVWEKLRGHSWPGNVRELQNCIRRAVLVAQGPRLLPADVELGTVVPESHGGEPVTAETDLFSGARPDSAEEEALTGLRQAIGWALRTGRPNPGRLLHNLLDRELASLTSRHAAAGTVRPESSLPALVEVIRRSGVLEPEQAEELDRQLLRGCPTAEELTAELLRRGWLTTWQTGQLGEGRGGALVLGQYVLLELVGQGGMGQVFKARQRRLKRLTALKVIRPERLDSPGAVERFRRETEAAARLAHPNIARIYDAGEVNGRHFLAMEYVEGTDLAQRLKKQGPLPVELACDCIRQAALGLQHLHECGMLHRDVKPSNLLLAGAVIKLLDLGVARLTPLGEQEGTEDRLTQTGMIVGTLDYIAPEQAWNAGAVDVRSDLYSLGCTFYHCLTGQVPFPGNTPTQKLLQHQLEQESAIGTFRQDVPKGVVEVVRRLMAKRPEDRYQTAAELLAALPPGGG